MSKQSMVSMLTKRRIMLSTHESNTEQSHLNDLSSMGMPKGIHEESVIEEVIEEDDQIFSDFVRHKVVYNGLLLHK